MSYPGAKGQAGVFQRIIGNIRPHECFVEPFCGDATITRKKRPAQRTVLLDMNPKCIANAPSLPGVNAMVYDAFKWLRQVPGSWFDTRATVIYCDPPYLLRTVQGRLFYDHILTDAQHAELLKLLKSLKCDVLLSGYPSELYSSQLRKWRCITYRTRTRGATVKECLWCNFPEPDELHDWRFCGRNFRERLALKRLAARYLARLQRMAPRKRGYILHAIAQASAPEVTLTAESRRHAPKSALVDVQRILTPDTALLDAGDPVTPKLPLVAASVRHGAEGLERRAA